MQDRTQASGTGIGAPMRRVEDRRFVTGKGDFVDDFALPNMACAYVVRSPHAHARIVAHRQGRAAAAAPGVLCVLTGKDVIGGEDQGPAVSGLSRRSEGRALTTGRCARCWPRIVVRHVGDGVAFIVAQTLHQAKDAAELLAVDYEVLPAVTLEDALNDGAPKVWPEAASNVEFPARARRSPDGRRGLRPRRARHEAVAALSRASRPIRSSRARSSRTGSRGSATRLRIDHRRRRIACARSAADVLGMPELDLRVVSPDVGGGFGMKSQVYPEEILVLWAARKLDRPVKLVDGAQRRHRIRRARPRIRSSRPSSRWMPTAGSWRCARSLAIDLGAYLSVTAGSAPNNATNSLTSTYRRAPDARRRQSGVHQHRHDGVLSRHRRSRRRAS